MNENSNTDFILQEIKSINQKLDAIGKKIFDVDAPIVLPSVKKPIGISTLLEALGTDENSLFKIVQFEENDFILNCNIEGINEPEKQLKATLVILIIKHFVFDVKEIPSTVLKKKLEWLSLASLSNLSRNLKDYKEFLLPKGKVGSKNYAYTLTYKGIQEGIKFSKEILNQNKSYD